MNQMSKPIAYIRLIRPLNCLMIGTAVLIGLALTGLENVSRYWLNSNLGFITGFTLAAASMAMNDYYDRNIDAINEPERPIPSGKAKPKEAIALVLILIGIGLAAASLTSLACLFAAAIACLIFLVYTTVGKRSGLPGNFLVSACVAIPFLYGNIIATESVKMNVLIFAAIAFLANTGREITKGIVDLQGDKAQDVKTLAVRYGGKAAVAAAAAFFLSAVLVSPIPWLLDLVSYWFVPLVTVTDVGLIYSCFVILRNSSRETARKVKNGVLIWFLTGLLAFLAGTIR